LKNAESRRQIFESEERASLLPLPELPFEVKIVKECKAMKNGHVILYEDKHSYSVPYEHIGKQMRLIYDSRTVSVYWKHQLVAQHTRNYARNRYTTLPNHLATKHQFLAEWNPEFFVTKGNEIAPEVGSFMEKVMESKPHPELGYKACRGILNLQRAFGTQRLVAACKRAINYGQYSYMGVRQILDKKLDLLDHEEPVRDTPSHPNVRGRNYYKSSNS